MRADYLVAADGWDSPVRERLGIGLDGPGPFFHVVTALVDADLRPALRGRRVNIAYLQQPRPGTIVMAHDEAGQRWVFGTGYSPQYGESLADFPRSGSSTWSARRLDCQTSRSRSGLRSPAPT